MIPKFRAWDNAKQKMVEKDRILIWGDSVLILDEGHDWNINDLSASEIDDKYLMQSTGLFDKNGVEIFEGDVVKHGKVLYLIKLHPFGGISTTDSAGLEVFHGLDFLNELEELAKEFSEDFEVFGNITSTRIWRGNK